MKCTDFLHLMLLLIILSIAFWPLKFVKYGAFLAPLAVCIGWIVFDGCLLMPYDGHTGRRADFLYPMCKQTLPGLSREKFGNWLTTVLVAIPTVVIARCIAQNRL